MHHFQGLIPGGSALKMLSTPQLSFQAMQNQARRPHGRPRTLDGSWQGYLLGAPILGFIAISLLAQPVGAAPNPAEPLVQIFDSAAYAPGNQPPDPRSGNYWLKAVISNVISDNGISGVKISLQANLNDDPAAYIERVAFNLNPFRQIQPGNKLRCAATTPNICMGNPFKEPKTVQWGYLFEENDVDLANRASGFDFELILPSSNKGHLEKYRFTLEAPIETHPLAGFGPC